MKNQEKTKKELIEELRDARQHIVELEASQSSLKTEREKILLSFVEQLTDGVVIMNEEGKISLWNQAFEDLRGLSADELDGKPIWELQAEAGLIIPSTPAAIKKSVLEFYENGTAPWLNKVYRNAYTLENGDERVLEDRKFSVRTDKGFLLGGMLRDVTELEEVKSQLSEMQDRFEKARLAVNEGVWDWDLTTSDVYFDPRYYEMMGYEVDEFPHRLEEFEKRVHPEDLGMVRNKVQKLLDARAGRLVVQFRYLKKDGSWMWILGRGVIAANDETGKPIRLVGSHADISRQVFALERLRESEEQFRLLADYTLDWEYWFDARQGKYMYMSPACEKITGYSRAELIAAPETFFTMVHPEYRDAIREHYAFEGVDQEGTFTTQFPIITKHGQERWLEHRCQPVYDYDENYIGRRGNNRDITELKAKQFALRESEEKFSQSFHLHPTAMQIVDIQSGLRIDANESFFKLFGYAKEEVIGKPIAEFNLIPNSFDEEKSWNLLKKNGEVRDFPVKMLTKSGEWKEILLSAVQISLRDEKLGVFSFIDITAHVRAEEQLRLQAHALKAAANGILITDSNGIIQWSNPAFSALTGYSFKEALGQNPRVLKSEKNSASLYSEMWKTITAGNVWRGELVNKRKDGSLYTEEMTISPLVTEDNRIENFVAVKQDISERKQAEKNAEEHFSRLNALRKIDRAISNSLDIKVTLHILLRYLREELKADVALIFSYDNLSQNLKLIQASGLSPGKKAAPAFLRLGNSYAGKIALDRSPLFIPDLIKEDTPFSKELVQKGFCSYYGVPLISMGELTGVLEVMQRTPLALEENWIQFLHTLAEQAALAIDNNTLFANLQRSNMNLIRAYDETIRGWAQALELRDMETKGHSQRVVGMTLDLAKAYGIGDNQLVHIQRGALLHDIGKMGIPDSILQKPGPLNDDEWAVMKKHPEYAFEWLSSIDYLRPALDIPHYHHEHWDGTGYPCGLKGKQIPVSARLFSIVDVWDALCSDRPYRAAWSEEKTLAYIEEHAGTHFDPDIVTLFTIYLEEK